MPRFPSAARSHCSGLSVVTVQSYRRCFLQAGGLVFIHHSSTGGKTKERLERERGAAGEKSKRPPGFAATDTEDAFILFWQKLSLER